MAKMNIESKWIRTFCIVCMIIMILVLFEMVVSISFDTSIVQVISPLNYLSYHDNVTIQYVRTGIFVELSTLPKHVTQLHAMLYPSWLYVNSLSHIPLHELIKHPQIQWKDNRFASVKFDLIIFCEQESCDKIPLTCFPLGKLKGLHKYFSKLQFTKMQSGCYYYKLDTHYTNRAFDQFDGNPYRFLPSLLFLIEEPCRSIIKWYDYILRTDVDAFLAPSSLVYIPRSKHGHPLLGQFGSNYAGSPFTAKRLQYVANKLNLKHAGLRNMQSTWYLSSEIFLEVAEYAVNLTVYCYKEEFTDEICKEIEKNEDSYNEGKHIKCGWPHWYDGVSSLYGSNLAINHVLYDHMMEMKRKYKILFKEWKTEKLDVWDDQPIKDTVQLHVVVGKHEILDQIAMLNSSTDALSELCSEYYNVQLRSFYPIETAMYSVDYASRIVGHVLRDVCATIMTPINEDEQRVLDFKKNQSKKW